MPQKYIFQLLIFASKNISNMIDVIVNANYLFKNINQMSLAFWGCNYKADENSVEQMYGYINMRFKHTLERRIPIKYPDARCLSKADFLLEFEWMKDDS